MLVPQPIRAVPALGAPLSRTVTFRVDEGDCDAAGRLSGEALVGIVALACELAVCERLDADAATVAAEVRAYDAPAAAGDRLLVEVDGRAVGDRWALVAVVSRVEDQRRIAVLALRVDASARRAELARQSS